ncbi:hypothetical protein B0H34DRAFT_646716, partial [Crassisporium funariophilum]
FYQLLSVRKDASVGEIKAAYHRALLRFHPDKRDASTAPDQVDIDLLKEAYTVLSNPELRHAYNAKTERSTYLSAPRPAQVVSLEDFDEEVGQGENDGPWRYPCRCGGSYRISVDLMEKGEHLIACNSCSEVVWVGYELSEV